MSASLVPWQRASKRYRFINAQIIDTKDAQVYKNCSIDIADGVIRRLSRHAEATAVNNDAMQWSQNEDITLVNLEGKYVLPGLIDCHVHLAMPPGEEGLRETLTQDANTSLLRQPWLAMQMLDRGFTTIRDCGGANLALKTAFDQGLYPGPRLFISGHAISQTGGHGDVRTSRDQSYACCGGNVNNIGRIADGPDQCMYAAREELRQGADFLKIVVSGGVISPTDRLVNLQYAPEEIRAFTKVAKDAGTYVTAHAYTPAAIQNAISNGVHGIEHGNLIDKPTAAMMAEKGVFLTPTLVTYKAMASKEFAGFLPPAIAAKNIEVLQAGFQSVQLASDAGVTMVFGTDLVGPLQVKQSEEFSLRNQAGQTAAQILQAATINGAKLLQHEDKLGRIKEGYFADLLILNASPLDNIEVLCQPQKHILAVLKAGKVMTSRWSKLKSDADNTTMIE
ncbi:hypothetical protein AMS68_000347 [Peltaster fructicola]|uniref:Amidohydrolase-related domain-containing protein n=1 Tax=Peltaster fructicola TaxID=286661 RepID=A0A6H0XJY9_9PEZI|nr:hypothetical protein AMS68_000347 [Peltaster fructicola]